MNTVISNLDDLALIPNALSYALAGDVLGVSPNRVAHLVFSQKLRKTPEGQIDGTSLRAYIVNNNYASRKFLQFGVKFLTELYSKKTPTPQTNGPPIIICTDPATAASIIKSLGITSPEIITQ